MSGPRDVPISKLLHKIVSALIDRPEFLSIKTFATEDGATFTIDTHLDDTGKLIGKQGRNAKSIFTCGRSVFFRRAGVALATASRTMRRCTPSFRAMP